MQLLIAFEGCSPMCRWKGRYDGQAAVSTVLADLCSHCGLSPKTTKLRHADQLLKYDQFLPQVCEHQAKLLELTATFKVTVAFFIWYSFSWSNTKKHETLATIWQRSVEHRASTAAMDKDISQYKEEMSQFLDLHHTDEIPLVALQHSGYPHAAVDSTQDLQHDSSCVGPGNLFFLNSVLQVKVDMGIDPEAAFTPWDDNFSHSCQPHQPTDADLFASLSLCKHMGPIRAAVLLLKLLLLASSAKGAADFSLTAWHALKLLCDRVHLVADSISDSQSVMECMLGLMHNTLTDDKYDDEQLFCGHLTQLALPILRQCAMLDEVESTVCCRLLLAVMHASQLHVRQATASRIIDSGGLAALVAAMTNRGGLTWFAYHVLDHMLSRCQLPAKQISMIQDKLAGMHGVRVLSNLMSPFVRKQQPACHQKFVMLWAAESYGPYHIKLAPIPEPAAFFRGLASLIDTLLDKHPFRQASANLRRTPAGHRRQTVQPAARSGSAATAHSPSAVGLSHSDLPLDEHFGVVDSWPTPSAAAWEDIQTVACRLWLTLEWLLTPDKQAAEFSGPDIQGCWPLMLQLAALLHKLLAGHVLDPKLNMQRIFSSGMMTVMSAWYTHGLQIRHVNDLGWLLLKRMVSDSALRSLSNLPSTQIMDAMTDRARSPQDHTIMRESFPVTWLLDTFFIKRVPIKPLSGLFADALYAAMGTKLNCCLLVEQKLHPGCSYHQAISDLEGCRPLQLTLAACWARMISVHLEGYRPDGFPPPHPHAYRKDTLNLAVTCLNKALLVPLPWSTEHCIGLQRVMMRVSEVMQPFQYQKYDKYKDVDLEKREDCVQLLVKLLQQWRKAGPVPGLASLLMVGAVHALLALKPAELTLIPVGGDKNTPGFQTVLVDLLVDLSAQACVTADSDNYLHGHLGDSLQERLPRLPASIVDTLMKASMHPLQKQYFVQHAFLPCARNFVEDARQAMMHWEADNGQMRLVILPAAFTLMLDERFKMVAEGNATEPLLKQALLAALQSLFLLVDRLVHLHTRGAKLPAGGPFTAEKLHIMVQKRESSEQIDLIISSLDSIQKQPPWAVALAEVMRDEWCSSHKSAKARLAISLQILSEKKFLPGPITKRLQGCFAIGRASMQSKPGSAFTPVTTEAHAAADAAAAELMAEAQAQQQHAAAKAAAKKAKKQKQKAQKQLKAQQPVQEDITPPAQVLPSVAASQTAASDIDEKEGIVHAGKSVSASKAKRNSKRDMGAESTQAEAVAQKALLTGEGGSDTIPASW